MGTPAHRIAERSVVQAPARWIKGEHIMEHMGKKVTVFGSFVRWI